MEGAVPRISFDGTRGRRRGVGLDSSRRKHPLDAVEVKAVAHRDAASGVVLDQYSRDRLHALKGVTTGRIDGDFFGGHALLNKIIAPDTGLRVELISSSGAGGHDEWSQAFFFKIEGVVEPRLQHRGGLSRVLRRTEDDDSIGR